MNPFSEQEIESFQHFMNQQDFTKAWDAIVAPLHERLVAAQSFDILEELPPVARMILIVDYLEAQIVQGGFIQLFQNGYAPLLVTGIETLQELGVMPDVVLVMDEALKHFSRNINILGRETTVAAFANLYQEFPQFQLLDKEFETRLPTIKSELLQLILAIK